MPGKASMRFAEGLGYVGAAMIAMALLTKAAALQYFLAVGAAFCVIAVVRLTAIGAALRDQSERGAAPGGSRCSDRPGPKEEETQ